MNKTNRYIADAIYRADKVGFEHGLTIEELAPLIAKQVGLPVEEIDIGEIEERLARNYWVDRWM